MAKKRKSGERYPSGDLKPDRYPPTTVRRILDEARRQAVTPLLGSVVGVMLLDRKLTEPQFSALNEWAGFVGRYDRLVGNKARTVKSPSYQKGLSGGGEAEADYVCRYCDCSGDFTKCDLRARMRREWNACEAALGSAWNVVYNAVLHGQRPVTYEQVLDMQDGATRLAAHYGYVKIASAA